MPHRSSKKRPKRATKRRRSKPEPDVNQVAHWIMTQTTSTAPPAKNPHAVELGKLGGPKGGRARAEKLTPERRSEIASKAARTRWKIDQTTPNPSS